ncbi:MULTISPECIES: TetR/AcrR family transcriptional regulator [Amycolatopsis]|uniref:TetR/AcrR family transcriptional regulator n=1 Tax=Amycolatopsis thermalba TaxID=944492 RepID=A0ABY4P0R2_9PSEU|nr:MULTISPECIES: TetR/AcrR family transcriptional regulator [Amycolatopsis]OXM64656.1 TetR family transcriptional regulator [Amycolatopsis sp. KNN50.9b]UQS25946.1 TetR/AcrR family transcriptional regulator [Amycolatopsis thermalba]
MARPKDQAKRRDEIVAAAGRAILRRGLTGLRVRDVAEEAGLSAGLVSYYYRDLDELLLEVHQDAVDRFYWGRAEAADSETDPRGRLVRIVEAGLPADENDPVCRVLYETHVHASRSRTHAALMTALWDREVSLYSAALAHGRDAGVFRLRGPVADVAANAVALEDAYGLHVVGRNSSVSVPRARALVLRYLETETGCELTGGGQA